MEITIAGHTFEKYNEVEINLKYDDIADKFSFSLYFDPDNQLHKKIFMPGTVPICTITHRGILILTGVILYHHFSSSANPPRQLINVHGYSLCGVIGDCNLLNTDQTETADGQEVHSTNAQFQGLSIAQIARRVCDAYPFEVIIDPEVQEDANAQPLASTTIEVDEIIAHYLNKICTQKNIVLSHDQFGNLVLTRAKTTSLLTTSATLAHYQPVPRTSSISGAPAFNTMSYTTKKTDRAILYNFTNASEWTDMDLVYDCQQLHSLIQVVGQTTGVSTAGTTFNATDGLSEYNPYLIADINSKSYAYAAFRYRREIQTVGKDNQTLDTARSCVGDEMKEAIILSIKIEKWVLNGHLVTPNQLITAINPEVYLYNKSIWLIQEVTLRGNEVDESAELTCVLPSAFDESKLVNIFQQQ